RLHARIVLHRAGGEQSQRLPVLLLLQPSRQGDDGAVRRIGTIEAELRGSEQVVVRRMDALFEDRPFGDAQHQRKDALVLGAVEQLIEWGEWIRFERGV